MESGPLSERVTEFADFTNTELSQAQRDLNEVRILVRQTSGEVERLTQRSGQSLSKQREAEANLENLSREEIRQIFATACEAQLRLLMMQAQLEQLQSRQRSLEKYVELLQRVVEMISSLPAQASRGDIGVLSASASATTSVSMETAVGQQMMARIIGAQEDERDRVARQIHDGPAQALTNVVLRAEICERLLSIDAARARAELAQLKELITNTLRDTRRFIFDVRPMILDDLGLVPTLKKYVETFDDSNRFTVDLSVIGEERRLEPHVEVSLFRIAQEALQNVRQHASASKARITLYVERDRLSLTVEDDGVGFNVDEIVANARERKGSAFGIARILERAGVLGGRVDFESSPGRGARIVLLMPLSP